MTYEQNLQETLRQLETARRSLTELRAQLVQCQKMAALGTLLAGVAHELNTPIGALRSMHQSMLQALGQLKETLNEACVASPDALADMQKSLSAIDEANGVIGSAADRISHVVLLLRNRSRAGAAERSRIDVNLAVADSLSLLSYDLTSDIQLIREFGQLPEISGYASELDQVFLNLLLNARQAIEGEGWIRVRTFAREARVIIVIGDSGCGIPKENLEKLFEPGYTTKGEKAGMGLGLYICRQIVTRHGGDITVASTPGRGTEVTVTLPVDHKSSDPQ